MVNDSTQSAGGYVYPAATAPVGLDVSVLQNLGEAPGIGSLVFDLYFPRIRIGNPDYPRVDTPDMAVPPSLDSQEVVFRLLFDGVTSAVSGLRISAVSPLPANVSLLYGCAQTYTVPINTNSLVAVTGIPTSVPGSANITIGGSLSASSGVNFYSDYVYLQVQAGASAVAGSYDVPLVIAYSVSATLYYLYVVAHIVIGTTTVVDVRGEYFNNSLVGQYG